MKCVVPSRYMTVAWAARLQYSITGDFPTGYAGRGKLYVRVFHQRKTVVTLKNGVNRDESYEETEYYPIDGAGVASRFHDDHGEHRGWPPNQTGHCAIYSEVTLTISVEVLPNADGDAFGTPKYVPGTKTVHGLDKPSPRRGGAIVAAMTAGAYEPHGYRGKKWRTKYTMNPYHCTAAEVAGQVSEPTPGPIPLLKIEEVASEGSGGRGRGDVAFADTSDGSIVAVMSPSVGVPTPLGQFSDVRGLASVDVELVHKVGVGSDVVGWSEHG